MFHPVIVGMRGSVLYRHTTTAMHEYRAPPPLPQARSLPLSCVALPTIHGSYLTLPRLRPPTHLRHSIGRVRCLVGKNRKRMARRYRVLAAAAQQHRRQHALVSSEGRTSADGRKYGSRYLQRFLEGVYPLMRIRARQSEAERARESQREAERGGCNQGGGNNPLLLLDICGWTKYGSKNLQRVLERFFCSL